jgi:hypothetical protein
MKLASCDFCPKSKARPRGDCLTTTIDGRVYDICPECKGARDVQLQGKGIAAPAQPTWRFNDGSTSLQPPYKITCCNHGYGVRPSPYLYKDTAAGGNN